MAYGKQYDSRQQPYQPSSKQQPPAFNVRYEAEDDDSSFRPLSNHTHLSWGQVRRAPLIPLIRTALTRACFRAQGEMPVPRDVTNDGFLGVEPKAERPDSGALTEPAPEPRLQNAPSPCGSRH